MPALDQKGELETYNGCILADSVGLGKTFTALAVIKYYELRNKSVLVLAPKKLADNWTNYNANLTTNIFASDRFNYDALAHTDLSRIRGESLGIPLDRVNWGNYGGRKLPGLTALWLRHLPVVIGPNIAPGEAVSGDNTSAVEPRPTASATITPVRAAATAAVASIRPSSAARRIWMVAGGVWVETFISAPFVVHVTVRARSRSSPSRTMVEPR